jgi:protein SCO1/2
VLADVTFKVVPSPRLRLALTVTLLCAAAMAAIVATAPGNGATAGGAAPTKTGRFYGATLPASAPAVDFALTDQNGRTIRLSSYRGQVVAIAFLYTTCANVCPDVVAQLMQAIGELPHPIQALAISVDPGQDNATNVKSFLLRAQVLSQLHYLVARRSVLEPIWRQFGIRPQRKLKSSKPDFTVEVVLIDKTGRPRVRYTGTAQMDPDAITADMRTLQALPQPRVAPRRVDI